MTNICHFSHTVSPEIQVYYRVLVSECGISNVLYVNFTVSLFVVG